MKRVLAALILISALPCFGQSAAPLSATAGTLAERTLNATQSGLYYLPTNPPTLTTVTATALATPGSITVTPVLSKVATITTVAGSALVDGDYLTVEYDTGLTVPIEFDLSPGDGTSGGRVPLLFTAGDSADLIRDNLILLLNAAVPASLTASSGGAATVALVLDTPGAAGGTLTENVADGGFAVTGFADPTAATTVTYKLVARLANGTTTEAGAASSTAASTATLSASNFLRLTWSAVTNAASYDIYRTVSPTSPATTGKIVASTTALTVDDTGLAGGGETAPATNSTGRFVGDLTGTASGNPTGSGASGRLTLWSGAGTLTSDAGLTYSGTGATFAMSPTTITMRSANALVDIGTVGNSFFAVNPAQANGSVGFTGNTVMAPGAAFRWNDAAFAPFSGSVDTSLSRISAGVVGVGTGAAGNANGALYVRGGVTTGPIIITAGVGGSSDFDVNLTRRAAATLQLGAADSATPVAQTLAFQGSRGGTDTNTAGADATIQGSLGTGTGASGKIVFKVGTPNASGSTRHTANTVLTLQDTGTGGTPSPAVISAGPVTSPQYRLSALNTAPSSATDTGTLGEIRIDSGYIYVCTATNTWVRAALATWP